MTDDRLILHTVHTDDGYTELYYSRAQDDFAHDIGGSLLFHRDGSITFKFRRDDDEPMVLVIKDNRVVVSHDEDQLPMSERLTPDSTPYVIFDSDTAELES